MAERRLIGNCSLCMKAVYEGEPHSHSATKHGEPRRLTPVAVVAKTRDGKTALYVPGFRVKFANFAPGAGGNLPEGTTLYAELPPARGE